MAPTLDVPVLLEFGANCRLRRITSYLLFFEPQFNLEKFGFLMQFCTVFSENLPRLRVNNWQTFSVAGT